MSIWELDSIDRKCNPLGRKQKCQLCTVMSILRMRNIKGMRCCKKAFTLDFLTKKRKKK